jgi:hypothetical protein
MEDAMDSPKPRYSKEEHARRGVEIYERDIRARIEPDNKGRIVAIDVDSGAWEIADDSLTAARRLQERCPEAQTWCIRIGFSAVHRFGPRVAEVRA